MRPPDFELLCYEIAAGFAINALPFVVAVRRRFGRRVRRRRVWPLQEIQIGIRFVTLGFSLLVQLAHRERIDRTGFVTVTIERLVSPPASQIVRCEDER